MVAYYTIPLVAIGPLSLRVPWATAKDIICAFFRRQEHKVKPTTSRRSSDKLIATTQEYIATSGNEKWFAASIAALP
jgi:hypothetical protein